MGMFAVRFPLKNSNKLCFEEKIKKFNTSISQSIYRECTPLVLSFITITMPAQASGKVFDFNATLPAMAVQFLLLMVFLDKTWFEPVGKVLDERDTKIQTRLSSVKSGDDELETLAKEAENLLKAARTKRKQILPMLKARPLQK